MIPFTSSNLPPTPQAIPSVLYKSTIAAVSMKVVWTWLLVFWFVVPWAAIGLNFGFNRCLCSSTWVRSRPYLHSLCAGTLVSQIDEVPWYVDLWKLDQQASNSPQSDYGLPLHIEKFMTTHARLRHPALAITHQLSKTVDRHPGTASDELAGSFRKCNSIFQ